MELPRIMIGATSSGSGKTLITCGILQAFVNRGLKVASFKCGPDYIDPMFHSKIIGTKSRNLDTFFTQDNTTKYLFGNGGKGMDISVIEGVMGFYDGLGVNSFKASSYELANITDTPVILVVDCKGMSRSILPIINGFVQYQKSSHIVGVILNQVSKGIYKDVKDQIENELQVKVLGYVPFVNDLVIKNRHLGLISPDEIEDYHSKLDTLANIFEETIALDDLLQIGRNTSSLIYQEDKIPRIEGEPRIAVARDEAFCFYYEDNLQLLKDMGATLIEFSPLHDDKLPDQIHGLLLGGGYPELFADKLSENISMRESIKLSLLRGLPCIAECGGFMYLHKTMENMDGLSYPMVGMIDGKVYKTNHLQRFGYISLSSNQDQLIAKKDDVILGHEFHYFDSTALGESFTAAKPLKDMKWNCIHGNDQLCVGFPHLYYYSNLKIPYNFLTKCMERAKRT